MGTKIEWVHLLANKDSGETWNPVTGCSKISEGCRYCYAERISLEHGFSHLPWTKENASRNVELRYERLEKPIHWLKPKAIFVDSMSDLFHELVSFAFIDQVFETMLKANWHFYYILTKRPERMLEWLSYSKVVSQNDLPNNVGFGVTAEDQKNFLLRIPYLAQLESAALRFVSCEPLLGKIDMNELSPEIIKKIQWLIVGGESGFESSRPMATQWVKKIKADCQTNNIPFLFKQWGEWLPADQVLDPAERNMIRYYSSEMKLIIDNEEQKFYKVGKMRAGRLLDAELFDDYPTQIGNDYRPTTTSKLQPSLFD